VHLYISTVDSAASYVAIGNGQSLKHAKAITRNGLVQRAHLHRDQTAIAGHWTSDIFIADTFMRTHCQIAYIIRQLFARRP